MWKFNVWSGVEFVTYLEVRAGNTFGNLFKKRFLDLDKLSGLDDIEYLLNLPEEHDFLLGAGLRPELEEALDDLLGQGGVLLKELDHAVGQLSVVQRQTSNLREKKITKNIHQFNFYLVQGNQDPDKKLLVLSFQRQGEAVDDRSKDLKKLSNTIEVFSFINEPGQKRSLT